MPPARALLAARSITDAWSAEASLTQAHLQLGCHAQRHTLISQEAGQRHTALCCKLEGQLHHRIRQRRTWDGSGKKLSTTLFTADWFQFTRKAYIEGCGPTNSSRQRCTKSYEQPTLISSFGDVRPVRASCSVRASRMTIFRNAAHQLSSACNCGINTAISSSQHCPQSSVTEQHTWQQVPAGAMHSQPLQEDARPAL